MNSTMTQAEQIAYDAGYRAGAKEHPDPRRPPYSDNALCEAWLKGYSNGSFEYLDDKRYF